MSKKRAAPFREQPVFWGGYLTIGQKIPIFALSSDRATPIFTKFKNVNNFFEGNFLEEKIIIAKTKPFH